jgi:hypothetical protein
MSQPSGEKERGKSYWTREVKVERRFEDLSELIGRRGRKRDKKNSSDYSSREFCSEKSVVGWSGVGKQYIKIED